MGTGYSVKSRSKAEAEILIYEDVGAGFFGGVTAKQFASDLKGLGKVELINLRINSAGGDVFDGLAIYRLLVDHPALVTTHVDGLAASIASVIAMAGDEIKISESGFMMIHEAWGMAIGNASDHRKLADLLETTTANIAGIYADRTKTAPARLAEMMAAETWMTGAQAVKNGFADSMVDNLKIAAAWINPEKHKFQRVPKALHERPVYSATRRKLELMKARLTNAVGVTANIGD